MSKSFKPFDHGWTGYCQDVATQLNTQVIQMTYQTSGFNALFGNGVSVSVQWGRGTYSDNRHCPFSSIDKPLESDSAEVAAYDEFGRMWEFNGGDVVTGWVTKYDTCKWIIKFVGNPKSDRWVKLKIDEMEEESG